VEKLFTDLRALILAAALCQKPDEQALRHFLNPLQADIEAVTRLKEASRKDREWFTHLSTVAEGAPCVGWVTVVRMAQVFTSVTELTENHDSPPLPRISMKSKIQRSSMGIGSSKNIRKSAVVFSISLHGLDIDFSRDTKHVEWVRSYIGLLEQMRSYAMEHHTTGLKWNPSVSIFRSSTDSVS
jgi:adenylyl cyclase-associated protein